MLLGRENVTICTPVLWYIIFYIVLQCSDILSSIESSKILYWEKSINLNTRIMQLKWLLFRQLTCFLTHHIINPAKETITFWMPCRCVGWQFLKVKPAWDLHDHWYEYCRQDDTRCGSPFNDSDCSVRQCWEQFIWYDIHVRCTRSGVTGNRVQSLASTPFPTHPPSPSSSANKDRRWWRVLIPLAGKVANLQAAA